MVATVFLFYVFSFVAIASAFMVIAARNPVHSVLFLILAFVNAAGLFLLLGAEFLAMILVVVYVGAVAVLFLFVVMMLDVDFTVLKQGFLQYLPLGRHDRRHRADRAGPRGRRLDAGARHRDGPRGPDRAGRHQHGGARAHPLHAIRLLLPGGGLHPADRHDRLDRADAARRAVASSGRASTPRTCATARSRCSSARCRRAPACDGSRRPGRPSGWRRPHRW